MNVSIFGNLISSSVYFVNQGTILKATLNGFTEISETLIQCQELGIASNLMRFVRLMLPLAILAF